MNYKFAPHLLLIFVSCTSVISQDCETRIDYFPTKREDVTDKGYRRAMNSLTNTFESIKEDGEVYSMDYMNIARAYAVLKEPKDRIICELQKAFEADSVSTAQLFMMVTKSPDHFGLTKIEYDSMRTLFSSIVDRQKEETFDLNQYAKDGNFDRKLVELIVELKESDQLYRVSGDMEPQREIDEKNILIVDSLYNSCNQYIGKSMVGDEFAFVMWLIVQHSDLAHQEKYLPVIHKAVIENELKKGPLKMLIDRVHSKKYDYQIFGSQSKMPLADEEVIARVKKQYLID